VESADRHGPSWYEIVEGPDLEQGDILPRFPLTIVEAQLPTSEGAQVAPEPLVHVLIVDVVVLSQSCDIAVQPDGRRRVEHAVVCPVWEVPRSNERFSRNMIGNVLAGRSPTWHALAPCTLPGLERPHRFMELRRILTVPVEWAEAIANDRSPRLRLRSPWKEHMAPAVGNLFSRPALPYPIPPIP